MEKNQIFAEVIDIIEDITDIEKDEMEMESSLMDDLEISSIESFSIFAEIENKFGMVFPESVIRNIITIEDIVMYVYDKKSGEK